MRQILQNLSNGETLLAEVPCPQNRDGNLLIASRRSLVSAGTERMLVDFGKANFIDKARQQPDKVKQVLDKVKTDGLFTTIDAVRSKLDQPIPLGYCNAGVVLESGADGFKKGDRVVSNGHHAQVVRVAKNLCAKIPDQVDDDTAAFTVLAAIGLQGIRLIKPTLGETIIVSGLGLIGLMCVQMLRANGCRVLGIDYSKERCELASKFGAQTVNLSLGQDPIAAAQSFSRGRGVDGVIIAASAKNNDVIHQAATMCRKRGRIVLIGVVGLNLRRDDFFEKEITFQVSASYGPGRYDPHYEEKGHDYPVGFVRWTEQRNFEAVLDMMATGDLDVKPLISHRFPIDEALQAYELVSDKSALGILIEYPQSTEQILRQSEINLGIRQDHATNPIQKQTPVLGFIGAGNYASRILIPAFKATGASLEMLASSGGVSGVYHGKKAGFASTTTQLVRLWDNKKINTIVIATRHDEHASQVVEALKSGKNVFVEKPLALTRNELEEIKNAYLSSSSDHLSPLLMVGFNRRFAPHIVKMKSLLEIKREPKSIVITVNAGAIPSNHWTQDLSIGGGRIIGECCHFIDLMRYLVGHPIERHQAMMIGNVPGIDVREDKVTINLSFSDGSFGSIHYLANGGKSFPKERIEVFCGDAVLQMNNYRNLEGFGWQGFKSMKLWSQDKGQKACAQAFIDAISAGSVAPISFDEIIESSGVTIDIAQSLR